MAGTGTSLAFGTAYPDGFYRIDLTAYSADGKRAGSAHAKTEVTPAGVDLGRLGKIEDTVSATNQGITLMGGGTDVDAAMKWMITRSGGGDCVVLRSSGTNAYNPYLMGLSGEGGVTLASCRTLPQASTWRLKTISSPLNTWITPSPTRTSSGGAGSAVGSDTWPA